MLAHTNTSSNNDSHSSKKAHPCPQCSKSFSSTHQLAQHSRVHSGEKPYPCAYCERKFKQLSHLQQHTRLHTGERPYKCGCGRAFIQLSNLQQHMKTHETSSPSNSKDIEKNYFCIHCGKGFKNQTSLYTHQTKKHPELNNISTTAETTTSTITYVCQLCNKIYLDENSYKKHAEAHLQSNPNSSSTATTTTAVTLWPCATCALVFANEIGLISHLEQMKSDPKHQRDCQLLLTLKTEKTESETNINEILVNTLISSNGETMSSSAASGNEQIITANMLAQNIFNLNQTAATAELVQPQQIIQIRPSITNVNTDTIRIHATKSSVNFRVTNNNDNNNFNQAGNAPSSSSSSSSYKYYPS